MFFFYVKSSHRFLKFYGSKTMDVSLMMTCSNLHCHCFYLRFCHQLMLAFQHFVSVQIAPHTLNGHLACNIEQSIINKSAK